MVQLTPTLAPAAMLYGEGAFAVAPMMDYTNRFLRFMLRRISRRATLYTEMVTANTIVHCDPRELSRFLGTRAHFSHMWARLSPHHFPHTPARFSFPVETDGERERPVVLQLGGSDPHQLRAAAAIAAEWGGFDAINLNCGCPSDRVAGGGGFGAAMMAQPELVGACCAAIRDGTGGSLPVSVKCRVGLADSAREAIEAHESDLYEGLSRFVTVVAAEGGVTHFAVHARQAVLGGLSPAQNREVPPLRHHLVHSLAREYPQYSFSLNGGLNSHEDIRTHLDCGKDREGGGGGGANPPPLPRPHDGRVSGVMLGRAVIARPWQWSTLDTALFNEPFDAATDRRHLLHEYAAFGAEQERRMPLTPPPPPPPPRAGAADAAAYPTAPPLASAQPLRGRTAREAVQGTDRSEGKG